MLLAPLLAAVLAHTLVLDARDGRLRDVAGHPVGRYALHCAGTRCAGSGRTPDGRLAFSGGAHVWRITGGTGAYRGARGTVRALPLSDTEDLVTVSLRTPAPLHAGVVRIAGGPVVARADRRCARAARALAALPPFPFTDFDPLHPDSRLPQVGAFFTGPGDPRPVLRRLDAGLRALHGPAPWWRRLLAARAAEASARERQDAAALADDAPAFVRTVHANGAAYRRDAIAATLLGARHCVL
jgi:hypothetical protein